MKDNYKKYQFYGLNRKDNILSGIILFIMIIIVIIISWSIFKEKFDKNSLLFSIFFVTSNAFIAVTIFLILVAKKLHKKWRIEITSKNISIYYNSRLVIQSSFFDEIKYIKLKNTRYLYFKTSSKSIRIQVQNYKFTSTNDLILFDDFWKDFQSELDKKYIKNDLSNHEAQIIQYIK